MTLDLSSITDALIGLVQGTPWTTAPIWAELGGPGAHPAFTPNFSGLAPDAIRSLGGAQLSLFLYHVEADHAREALFWQPQMGSAGGEPIRFVPMALNLFYLMSAYSESSYAEEQQAMSVAMRIFHATPIVRNPTGPPAWELTLTMEHRSYDEMSRLWQAATSALRLSVVYRASVTFIDPDASPGLAKDPTTVTVTTGVLPVGFTMGDPELLGTFREVSYTAPGGSTVTLPQEPATVAPGQEVWLLGSALGDAGTAMVHLVDSGGAGTDVSAWVDAAGSSPPGTGTNASRLVLKLPASTGSPPIGAPTPGAYQVSVSQPATPGTPGFQTPLIPLRVAALVDPAGGPVLTGPGPFTINGAGFLAGQTEISVGSASLVAGSGAGAFSVGAAGTSVSLQPPTEPAAPAGTFLPVTIRVAGIETDPAFWVPA
jgi:hypothetical protein